MSTEMDDRSVDGSVFKPAPPKPASPLLAVSLFLYHVALGVILAYAIYNVWPPQPWPKAPKANAAKAAVAADRARSQGQGQTPTPTDTTASGTVAPATSTVATDSEGDSGTSSSTEDIEEDMSSYEGDFPPPFWLFGKKFKPPLETRLILLVLLAGAIGSYVHATSSFVDYLGNRTFISSWGWWYLLRPFIGMMLALLFYFVFRGGFVTAGTNQGGDAAASFINPFGVAALAGLVGMFSKAAADKLNEVFLTMFKPEQGDAKRSDKLAAAMPAITAIDPNTGPATGGTPVTIKGTGFTEGAQVTFGGAAATSVKLVGDTLTAVTPPHEPGVVDVAVMNPDKQSAVLKDGFTYQ